MLIYRTACGSIKQAMDGAKVFGSEMEMLRYIVRYWKASGFGKVPFSIKDIVIDREHPFDDERVGWRNVMRVCVKRFGNEDYIEEYGTPQCIGFCCKNFEMLGGEREWQ